MSVDVSLAALQSAKIVIAQVNEYLPRTRGDSIIHRSHIDFLVEHSEPLPEMAYPAPSPAELAIGAHIADLVPDGATLQLGIGALPNAVLQCLSHHKDLGVHTEMFSDGLLPLIAMTSCTAKGISKIAPTLRSGAGVTVTRAHVHWVVTEFGAINLYGKSLRERAALLISIAHPDDRERLEAAAAQRLRC